MTLTSAASFTGSRRQPIAAQVRPYEGLARDYDALVGAALFPTLRDSFERCVRRLGIGFRHAADVGCGTGVFLEYLQGYGVPLIGVELSPEMLRIAATRLRRSGVLLIRQDLRRLRLPYPVDLITCNGDTLNYLLSDADLRQALSAFRANLTPGAHLIADVLTGVPPRSFAEVSRRRIVTAGRASRWRARVDPERRMTQVEIDLGRLTSGGWRWAREVHLQRWHPIAKLLRMLDAAGLRLIDRQVLDAAGAYPEAPAWVKLVAKRDR